MENSIDRDLDTTIDIIDATKSDNGSDYAINDEIDNVTDAINDVKYGDSDDETIENLEGIEPEKIEIEVANDNEAAEIELLSEDDCDTTPSVEESELITMAADIEDENDDDETEGEV